MDRMLDDGINDLVEEYEWISRMVVQEKKIGEVGIYVNLRKLNDGCMHDPFSKPLTDEVLEEVGGQEMYSFTYWFYGYH